MSSRDVFVQEVDGDRIVVINVPRAERSYKPVYVDGNPLCTYRRNGEGDYRCTKEEYQAMVRDASVKTQDMLILNEMDMTVFNRRTSVAIVGGCAFPVLVTYGRRWRMKISS